jgi:hypothetical protein
MKTTKAQFEIFKKECLKWINFFGMIDFEYFFYHEEPNDSDGNMRACVRVDIVGRIVSFFLIPDWKREITNERTVKKVAFHEVCEVLLWKLAGGAIGDIHLNLKQTVEETHKIIRILENKVFK